MGGEARGERRSDGRGRRSVRRLRCMDRSVERQVNTSLAQAGPAKPNDLLRYPGVAWQAVIPLIR